MDRIRVFLAATESSTEQSEYMIEGERIKTQCHARYYALQLCMLHYILINSLAVSTQFFFKDILPLIQLWVYVHRVVIERIFRNDLPVDFAWCLVCNHTRLRDFLALD